MLIFALLAAATLHEPTPDDIARFGFAVRPIAESVPRQVWNATRENYAASRVPVSAWLIYGREAEYQAAIDEALWRERVWDAVDDMARSCCPLDCRLSAARRLKARLGPVAYYLGELP